MRAGKNDAVLLAPLVKKLWPEHAEQSLIKITADYAEGPESAVFVGFDEDGFTGVAMCCLRHDYVEGCETRPVGYLEGIYVKESCRMLGIAKGLVRECEAWAREQGCTEFASDCALTNTASLHFHLGVGFEEANRIICFKKSLCSILPNGKAGSCT